MAEFTVNNENVRIRNPPSLQSPSDMPTDRQLFQVYLLCLERDK